MDTTSPTPTARRTHSQWQRLVEIRDELEVLVDVVPAGVEQAIVGLNTSIMRMCPHDSATHDRETFQRYEAINRVAEWVRCPQCRAGTLVQQRLDPERSL